MTIAFIRSTCVRRERAAVEEHEDSMGEREKERVCVAGRGSEERGCKRERKEREGKNACVQRTRHVSKKIEES